MNKVALKTAPLVDLNLDVGSGAAVKASQGDVWAGRGRGKRLWAMYGSRSAAGSYQGALGLHWFARAFVH